MKVSTLILTLAALAVSATAAHAKEHQKGPGPGRAKFLEKFDTNGDGKVDEIERKEIRQAMRSKARMKENHPGLRRAMKGHPHGKGHGGGNRKDKDTEVPGAQ